MEVKGSKIIVGVALGVVLIAAVIGLTLVFFSPETAPCASGDMAENPVVGGLFQPRNETFDRLQDAEAFICHQVPTLHADAWALQRIGAERTLPIDNVVDGDGFAAVNLAYSNRLDGRTLQIDITPFDFDDQSLPAEAVRELGEIDGNAATVIRGGINPNAVIVLWSYRKLQLRATSTLDDGFTSDDLLKLMKAVY